MLADAEDASGICVYKSISRDELVSTWEEMRYL